MNLHTEGWLKVKAQKAENKEQFEKVWSEHLNHISLLAYSLPLEKAKELLNKVKDLQQYVKIAVEHNYGETAK